MKLKRKHLEILVLILGFLLIYFPLAEGNPVRTFLALVGLYSLIGMSIYSFHRISEERKKEKKDLFL